jgi:GntR family transcriptional regulator, transcriptional repressor for pyruvate dehydrogenase complex
MRPLKHSSPQADGIHQDDRKPLPRRIADILTARILVGDLKPGDRLPPDRILAEQLGVDRTSLRSALSELAGRNIVRAVQGSGVVVLDYREHAGLDFLDAVFGMEDIDLGSAFNLELLDHWIEVMPAIVGSAFGRSKPADIAGMDLLFKRQLDLLEKGAGNYEIAAVEVEIQDEIVKLAGSTILRLFANSMRRFRMQFSTVFFRTIDMREHITTQRSLLQEALAGTVTPDDIAARYRQYLSEITRPHRSRIARLPANPNRRKKEPALRKNESC